MRSIIGQMLVVALILLTFFLATRPLQNPYRSFSDLADSLVFSTGNAAAHDRAEIVRQLKAFQKGYAKRDTASVDSFMRELFSQDNVLILGTMPQEVYVGYNEASSLVFDDWASWGDCTFLMDGARISVQGDVAWFATIGYVEFDLSSLLVLPLRLTGVLVREENTWKLQQVQYQFDLDISFYLVSIVVLALTLVVSVCLLLVAISRALVQSHKA